MGCGASTENQVSDRMFEQSSKAPVRDMQRDTRRGSMQTPSPSPAQEFSTPTYSTPTYRTQLPSPASTTSSLDRKSAGYNSGATSYQRASPPTTTTPVQSSSPKLSPSGQSSAKIQQAFAQVNTQPQSQPQSSSSGTKSSTKSFQRKDTTRKEPLGGSSKPAVPVSTDHGIDFNKFRQANTTGGPAARPPVYVPAASPITSFAPSSPYSPITPVKSVPHNLDDGDEELIDTILSEMA